MASSTSWAGHTRSVPGTSAELPAVGRTHSHLDGVELLHMAPSSPRNRFVVDGVLRGSWP